MNKSFEQEDFEAAIDKREYIKLKNYVANAILNNEEFEKKKNGACCEAEAAFKVLIARKDELPGLFTPYERQYGEKEFDERDKTSWTREYFIRQVFFLGENFCQERFEHVRTIGKELAKKKDTNKSYTENDEITHSSPMSANTLNTSEKKHWLVVAFIVFVIVIIVVAVVSCHN